MHICRQICIFYARICTLGANVSFAYMHVHIVTALVMNHPITILNDGSPTHYHIQTATFSTIDVTLCFSSRVDDFNYEVLSDNHTSDHYPVKISWKQPPTLLSPMPCFKPSQAKWTEFTELTLFENANIQQTPIDDVLRQIEQTIISAADNTIPKTSGHFSKPPVPWWSNACSAAQRNRIRAERTFHRNPTLENRIARTEPEHLHNTPSTLAEKNHSNHMFNQSTKDVASIQFGKKSVKLKGNFLQHPLLF